MRSSGGGGNVNDGDSAVAHVADGVVGGGKAVVSTFLELHTTLTYSRGTSSISGVGGSSQGRQEYQQRRRRAQLCEGARCLDAIEWRRRNMNGRGSKTPSKAAVARLLYHHAAQRLDAVAW